MSLELFFCPLKAQGKGWMWPYAHCFQVLCFTLKIYLHLFSNENNLNSQLFFYQPLFATFGTCRIKVSVCVLFVLCVCSFVCLQAHGLLLPLEVLHSSQLTFYRPGELWIREVMKLTRGCTAGVCWSWDLT